MEEKNVCPGCEKHCDLSAPSCGRGREFARTGVLPEHDHKEGHHHSMRKSSHCCDDVNEKLIINLRDIGHMMRMQYEGKASQKRILIILSKLETITQKELTVRLGIQPGSVSEILTKLENAGLIIRQENETDHRTTTIQLTDLGKQQALEATMQRQSRHEQMFACLTEQEKATLQSLLEKVSEDWEVRFAKSANHDHHHHHGHHKRQFDKNHRTDLQEE